jgi:signal transduction histidine kinase
VLAAAWFFSTDPAFPIMAASLRRQSEAILVAWEDMARQEMPGAVARLARDELRDQLPELLEGIADTLERTGRCRAHSLERTAPVRGHSRFRQRFNLREALTENRLLRRAILAHVEPVPLNRDQQIALNAAVDVAIQHGVLALFEDVQEQLRAAAESELRYLSFLSHELGNSLSGVKLRMAALSRRLASVPAQRHEGALLDELQGVLSDTISGMRQFLEHERLRKANVEPDALPVKLEEVVSAVMGQFLAEAEQKGLRVETEVAPDAVVVTNPTLVAIVLRNLIGNAVRHSTAGTIRVTSEDDRGGDSRRRIWALKVTDQGPGIAPRFVGHIFDAFERGEAAGQPGVGLGLAIASHAAKLLGAELSVSSRIGDGSTFTLTFAPKVTPAAGTGGG